MVIYWHLGLVYEQKPRPPLESLRVHHRAIMFANFMSTFTNKLPILHLAAKREHTLWGA